MTSSSLLRATMAAFFLAVSISARAEDEGSYKPSFLKEIDQANVEFRNEDYDATLKALDRADAITPGTSIVTNLRGAVATNQKDYDKARDLFKRAVAISPAYFPAKFNLAELSFLERKYADAREQFLKMLEVQPKNELLIYKIFFTFLMEENHEKSEEWISKIKFPSDTPAYYFARAARDFKRGQADDARKWIAESERIFSAGQNDYFIESLSDMGWVNRQKPGTF